MHKRVVQTLQAMQREKEEQIRCMQAAAGGASEVERREMAAAVAAKEAALKAATKLQAGDGFGMGRRA